MRYLLVVLAVIITTACTTPPSPVPEDVAKALAERGGGRILMTTKRGEGTGNLAYYIAVCRDDRIHIIWVGGTADNPSATRISEPHRGLGTCDRP